MQDQIQQLNDRIAKLEAALAKSPQFEEFIRDIIFTDNSTTASLSATNVVTSVNFGAQTVTTASLQTGVPSKFLKVYYRGQVYILAAFANA